MIRRRRGRITPGFKLYSNLLRARREGVARQRIVRRVGTARRERWIQITLTADCNGVFIAQKTSRSFTVKELMGGTSDATFDWEVAAKRKGYEDERLEPFAPETP